MPRHPYYRPRELDFFVDAVRIFEVRDPVRGQVVVTEAESEADALDRFVDLYPMPRNPEITELRP